MNCIGTKPCPICGKDDKLITGIWPKGHAAICVRCGLQTGYSPTQAEAIEQWNSRPIEDALQARIRNLETQLLNLNAEMDALQEHV